MAIGRFYRQDGSIQFDANIPPYAFQGKGTVTTISTTGSSPHWSTSSPSSALIPMAYDSDELIAVFLFGYGYARYANLSYNGQWYHIFHTDAPVGTTVTYYRFRIATSFQGDYGPGLQLFNTAGVRTYHSGLRAAVPVGFVSGVGSSLVLPTGRAYASVVQTQAGYERYVWSGEREVETNDKGQIISRSWLGQQIGRLYGVKWSNAWTADLVEVPFNDASIRSGATTKPADSVFYSNPINDVMLLDVTDL